MKKYLVVVALAATIVSQIQAGLGKFDTGFVSTPSPERCFSVGVASAFVTAALGYATYKMGQKANIALRSLSSQKAEDSDKFGSVAWSLGTLIGGTTTLLCGIKAIASFSLVTMLLNPALWHN